MNQSPAEEFRFGPYRLLPDQSVLLKDDDPIRVGNRALDMLILLVRNAGALVTKAQIMEEVWPDTIVVEANLSVHMSALRRALEDEGAASPYIVTVPGRGYRFAGQVARTVQAQPYSAPGSGANNNLPVLLTRLIGRSEIVHRLVDQIAGRRLTTIVGTGGVGKTAVALNAAERQIDRWRDGVWLIDFASLADAELAPFALATALGVEVRSNNPVPALVNALVDKQMLLVFDNCEHVIETVAMLTNAILLSARETVILATSREPLAIPGENVLRLEPLDVPPETELVGAQEALHYAAVQLLCERARAIDAEFVLGDGEALAASLICRKLGGIPLAIEFASALVPIFGLRGLSTRLDDRLRLLGDGQRTTPARHRTLTAALDWSYQLLQPDEQQLLRRLAVFNGGFTIESAAAIIGQDTQEILVAETIARLVRKSLVAPHIRDSVLRFRLLETTRAFALGVLEAAGETRDAEKLHALHFARALQGEGTLPSARVAYTAFVPDLDNIRTALRWAMSDHGDLDVALLIGVGALPLWFGLSLLTECGSRMTTLMSRVDPAVRQSANGAAIDIAVQATEIFTFGAADESYRDWTERQQEAERRDQLIERVRLLLGRWTYNVRFPIYERADEQSRDLAKIALSHIQSLREDVPLSALVEPAHLHVMGEWSRGTTLHHMGELTDACAHLQRFLNLETPDMRAFFMTITGFDRRSAVLGLLGVAKCLRGEVDEGLALADAGVVEARSTGKALPLCEALQWSAFAALIMAEPAHLVAPLIDELARTAKNHSLFSHFGAGLGLRGCLAAGTGKYETAIDLLQQSLAQLREACFGPLDPFLVGELAASYCALGQLSDAKSCVAEFESKRQTHNGFCGPELLRHLALVDRLSGRPDAAEAKLREACDAADRQGAWLWRLRSGGDLRSFLQARERSDEVDTERRVLEAAPAALRDRVTRLQFGL